MVQRFQQPADQLGLGTIVMTSSLHSSLLEDVGVVIPASTTQTISNDMILSISTHVLYVNEPVHESQVKK